MRTGLILMVLGTVLVFPVMENEAKGRSGIAREHPYAAEHIDLLPGDIKRSLQSLERSCGKQDTAAHYFSTTIAAGELLFRSLHFEDFACGRREAVCRFNGCLHEIYLEWGGRSRRVFSAYVSDVKLINIGDTIGLEITGGRHTKLVWNGHAFVPLHLPRKDVEP